MLLSVGESRVLRVLGSPEVEATVREKFTDVVVDDGEVVRSVQLESASASGRGLVSFSTDSADFCKSVPARRSMQLLLRLFNRTVLDADDGFLHLHCGAVVVDGQAILVAGESGKGKSTLVRALVLAGARYISDECVRVNGGRVSGVAKPISLRSTGGQTPTRQKVLMPASSIGLLAEGTFPVAVVVFPDWAGGLDERVSIGFKHRADTCHDLLGNALDVARHGIQSIADCSAVICNARCVTATYSEAATAVPAVLQAGAKPTQVAEVEVVPAADGRVLSSVTIDNLAVILEPTTSSLVTLNESATVQWVKGASAIEPDLASSLRSIGVLR